MKYLSTSIKCITFLGLVLLVSGCATYKQQGFPPELLGTWFYEFEDPDRSYLEQTYTFNLDGNGIIETRDFTIVKLGDGKIIRVYRSQDVKFNYFLPSSKRGKLELIINDSHGEFSFKIDNGYLIFDGFNNNRFDQSAAKYRKLSDTEAEKWFNAKGKALSDMEKDGD